MLYAERIEAGVVKINQISTGLALQAPFGGVKKIQHRFLQGTRRRRNRVLYEAEDGVPGLLCMTVSRQQAWLDTSGKGPL